jgi:hypothetical protein
MRRPVVACLSALVCSFVVLTATGPTDAADTFCVGTWKISATVMAPWADPKQKPGTSEQARLTGKSVELAAKRISRPNPFPCAAPHYKVSDFTADMIFQGAFGEMQSNNKRVDPNKIAASLGFTKPGSIKTLETGCEIDFHFVDEATAEIGLDNVVYTLKKQ